METKHICPLGCECEKIKKNTLYRCRWYIQIRGQHPQTGQEVDEWNCALVWNVIVGLEMARTNRGQTQAIESFRNETVKRQQIFNQLFARALEIKAIENQKKLEVIPYESEIQRDQTESQQ